MSSVLGQMDAPANPTGVSEEGAAAPSGIMRAQEGIQPITDLASFLQLLPEFDDGVAELSDAIAENRALRRAAAEAQEC